MVVGTTIYPCYEAEYNQEYLLKSRSTYQDSKGGPTMHDEHLELCKQLLVKIPPFSELVYACNLGLCRASHRNRKHTAIQVFYTGTHTVSFGLAVQYLTAITNTDVYHIDPFKLLP